MATLQQTLASTPRQTFFRRLARGLLSNPTRKRALLDVRELSPHLQRDMGLLDGNDLRERLR